MHIRWTSARSATFLALALLLAGCDGDSDAPAVVRADSAGIELVTSGASDTPLEWAPRERFVLGGADEGPESFFALYPAYLGTDGAGRIQVLNRPTHRVVTFDPAGEVVREVGSKGGGPGEFDMAASMSVTQEGDIAVFDYHKMALVRWDSAGELLPQIPFPHPPAIGGGRHQKVTPDGYIVSTGGSIGDERVNRLIAVAGQDTALLAAAVQPDQGMIMFERCGGGVTFPPLFTPSVIWDHRDGTTAVAPGDEYRIDVWRDGRVVRSIRRDVPVTAATRELAIAEAGDGFTIDFGRGRCTVPADEYADARGWAETVPAIANLALAADGRLWVQRRVPGEETPPIDVFDADGAYVGTLPVGTRFPALLLRDGGVGVIVRDELDVDRLVVVDGERDVAS